MNTHAQSRWCATRNWTTAFAFVAFTAFLTVQSWRQIGREKPDLSTIDLIFYLIAIVMIVRTYFEVFWCLRERVVLGIVAVGLIWRVALTLIPGLFAASGIHFALKSVALIASLSMLYSSLRRKGARPLIPLFPEKGE